jgi:hypothetical protein
MMDDHETRRKVIRPWMSLPKDKRHTAEQAAEFKETNGRQPHSVTELRHWMASAEGQGALMPHIDPADGTLVVDRRKFNRLPAKARSSTRTA